MKQLPPTRVLALAGLIALTLAGCGGGGGSAPADPIVNPPAAVVITGVAATGAAFEGGSVQIIDSRGTVVGTSGSIGADGVFTVTLAEGAKAPYVVLATRANANGQSQTLTSVVSSDTQTTVNVTPVTTLVAALLSPSGDPTRLADELKAGTAQITPLAVTATVEKVQAVLQPLLAATGTTGTDPLTGSFSANGTGYDRLLDSVQINIVPASSGANVEVAVKQQVDDTGAQPSFVTFSTSSAAPPALPAVDPAKLVEAGVSTKITAFLADLTACYAVPFAERVANVTEGSVAVTGSAADVIAPACRNVFHGSDPAGFLSNGGRVGRTASNGGAFASLFRAGATGVVFSQGSYEFTRANGDLVIAYKSRDTAGNETFDTFVVRKTEADGKLRLIGNQYRFPGSIQSYHQVRQFISLGQSAYNYRSVGFTVNVDNRLDANGNSIFDRVEVTTPRGSVLTLRPTRGFSFLPLVKGSGITGTNFVRLRSEFVDPATTGTIPTLDSSLFFSNVAYTDADLIDIPAHSAWTYRYFLAGNTGTTPDAEQVYKSRSRALSIDEFKQVKLSAFTPSVISDIQVEADTVNGTVPLPSDGPVDFGAPANGGGWLVDAGALPATSITLFGRFGSSGFNDSVNFGSTARTVTLPCAPASAGDTHCVGASASGGYAPGAVANGVHLFARDAAGREHANFYAMYKLTPN